MTQPGAGKLKRRQKGRSRRRLTFAEEMARMARDPQIQRVSQEILEAFRKAESDGLHLL